MPYTLSTESPDLDKTAAIHETREPLWPLHFNFVISLINFNSMNSAVLSTSTVAVARVATNSRNARNVAVRAEVRPLGVARLSCAEQTMDLWIYGSMDKRMRGDRYDARWGRDKKNLTSPRTTRRGASSWIVVVDRRRGSSSRLVVAARRRGSSSWIVVAARRRGSSSAGSQ